MEKDYYFKDICRMCGDNDLSKALSFTPTPPGNHLVEKDCLLDKQSEYPLDLYFCNTCTHVQLGHVVAPEVLYQQNYSYVSSTSRVFVEHLKDYAYSMGSRFNLDKDSFVVDIGSNDGTCLKFFKEQGIRVLGVDPAKNIAELACKQGVETIGDFFNLELAKKICNQFGSANYITSHNACAHIDDLDSVVSGVRHLLSDDGVFVLEVGYFLDVFQNSWFDTIYHEHVDYHTIKPFISLFSRFDMEVFSVERVSPQGGSIRVMAQKKNTGKNLVDNTVSELIALEEKSGLYNLNTFNRFESNILSVRDSLAEIIYNLKRQGKKIAGFGAPTKATTLMYHFNLSNKDIDFIVDENRLKQGLYSPGLHIPILSQDAIWEQRPDYLIILAWNFADSIIKNYSKYKDLGGKFIVPMPVPKIIED